MEHKSITLGSEANKYVLHVLRSGNALAHRLAADLDIASGTLTTRLPGNVNPKRALDLETGGLLPRQEMLSEKRLAPISGVYEPVSNLDVLLADLLQTFLAESKKHTAVFENFLMQASDPVAQSCRSHWFSYNRKVYHFIDNSIARNTRSEFIRLTLKEMQTTPQYVGALIEFEGDTGLRDRQEMDAVAIDRLAQHTKAIIVGAYDGEGFVIWNKP